MPSANPNNNAWLAKVMRENEGITRRWVADQLHVSPSTVDRWLAPKTRKGSRNPTYRKMQDMAASLLKYRLDDDEVPRWP